MLTRSYSIMVWVLNLFDPPPLCSMNFAQKVIRVVLVTVSLLLICVLLAMLSALMVFIVQQGCHMLGGITQFFAGMSIIVIGIAVNVVCILVLLGIKRADNKLMASSTDENDNLLK